jgi:hypothetical protein
MILEKEQIEQMTYDECRKAVKQLFKDHRMDTPWHSLTKEEHDLTDQVCNTLLWLQDRIGLFEDPRVSSMDPGAHELAKPKVEKTGPKRRQFRIGDTVYQDVQTAALKTGVKVDTLRNYVGRKPDIYGYID